MAPHKLIAVMSLADTMKTAKKETGLATGTFTVAFEIRKEGLSVRNSMVTYVRYSARTLYSLIMLLYALLLAIVQC
jgi:hypothetical protein